MSLASQVIVPPVRFGGFNNVSARLATGTPDQTVYIGISQYQGVGIFLTPVAVGSNLHQGFGVPQTVMEMGKKTVTSAGIIVGGPMPTASEEESLTQVWSG